MKIRIGNDFKTKWAITWVGEPEDFSDATDISLSFNIYDKKIELIKDVDYTITNNIIEIDCTPDICDILGTYNLELHYTKPNNDFIDGERRSAVDIDAFRIVGKSEKADATQDVSIISDAVAIFLDIAYKKLEEIEANEDVRITNEGERKDAEDEREVSEVERVASEGVRVANEVTRVSSEAIRVSNEEERVVAETSRGANEDVRIANEQTRITDEANRLTEEGIRIANEDARNSSEAERVQNEDARNSSEAERVQNEATRMQSEGERVAAEIIRQSNEGNRIEDEATRVQNEAERISEESVRQNNEANRINAEVLRVQAEDERDVSEGEREESEDIRVANENTRISNEQDRQINTTTAISNAEQATLNANNSAVYANEQGTYANEQGTYANEQGTYAEEMSSHPPTIINDYWHIWNFTTNQYETTGQYARGDSAVDGALVVQEKGQSAVNTMSQKAVTDELVQLAGEVEQLAYVKIKNEAVNGNFENGLIAPFYRADGLGGASTLAINSSTPISGNYDIRLTITTPATNSTRPIFYGLNRATNIGDKIYLHFYAKILSGVPIISGISNGESVAWIYGGDVVNGRNTRIIDVGGTGSAGLIYFSSVSVWDMQMDNFMRINLTEIFGAGNEPTEEEMDLLISTLGIDYFEGEITIPAQKIMQWQLKLIRKNKNAIIALGGTII